MKAWLADKSALLRMTQSPDAELWDDRIDQGLVHISSVTRLEIGLSARSGRDLREYANRPPLSLLPVSHLTPAAEDRAGEVQGLLADRGLHRAPSVPHILLIAAVAELGGLTVLHVDKDYDLIAELTGQPVERLRL